MNIKILSIIGAVLLLGVLAVSSQLANPDRDFLIFWPNGLQAEMVAPFGTVFKLPANASFPQRLFVRGFPLKNANGQLMQSGHKPALPFYTLPRTFMIRVGGSDMLGYDFFSWRSSKP